MRFNWWLIAIILILYELILGYQRKIKRRQIYQLAKNRANQTSKPLLIIGDPDNGFTNKYFGRDYNCGDLCIDLVGCHQCPQSITGRIEDLLPHFPSNSMTIFISCVLEYVDNSVIEHIIYELKRVSGGDLFIVQVEPYSFTSFIYIGSWFTGESGAKRLILTRPPFQNINYYNFYR